MMIIIKVMNFHTQAANSPSKACSCIMFNFDVDLFKSIARNVRVTQ